MAIRGQVANLLGRVNGARVQIPYSPPEQSNKPVDSGNLLVYLVYKNFIKEDFSSWNKGSSILYKA